MPSAQNQFDKETQATEVAAAFPDAIRDRTILITGVNKAGIGFATAQAFATRSPKLLILAGRSQSKLDECATALQAEIPLVSLKTLIVDLSSIKSVKDAAEKVLSWSDVPKIDLLINNAGIMRHGDSPDFKPTLTVDGIEDQFATNHIGHFLLTNLIMPKIISAAKNSPPRSTRIINLTSSASAISPFRASDFNWEKHAKDIPENERPEFDLMKMAGMAVGFDTDIKFIPTCAYGASKTCNILFSLYLNARLAKCGILSLAVNPGEIKTDLIRHTDMAWIESKIQRRVDAGIMHWKTLSGGASTTLLAACDPDLSAPAEDGTGVYLSHCQVSKAPAWSVNQDAAIKLWQISEELTGQKFEY